MLARACTRTALPVRRCPRHTSRRLACLCTGAAERPNGTRAMGGQHSSLGSGPRSGRSTRLAERASACRAAGCSAAVDPKACCEGVSTGWRPARDVCAPCWPIYNRCRAPSSTRRRLPRGVRASGRARPPRADTRVRAARLRWREPPRRARSGPRTGRSPPLAMATRSPRWASAGLRRRAWSACAARSCPPAWRPMAALPGDPEPSRALTRLERTGHQNAARRATPLRRPRPVTRT